MDADSRGLARRAFLALALFIGFYVLVGLVIAACLLLPVAEFALHQRFDGWRTAVCVGVAGLVAFAAFPRGPRSTEPGFRLRRSDCPRFFALVDDVARAARQAPPNTIRFTPGTGVSVGERGGFLGMGAERRMSIGLPVFAFLDTRELAAVLAHEFGHFAQGDTRIGGFILRTDHAIGGTLQRLERAGPVVRPLQAPFRAYGRLFRRLSSAVSRQQERSADRLAGRLVGGDALAGALMKLEMAGRGYRAFTERELNPILSRGRRPPIVAGLEAFLASPRVARDFRTALDESIEASRTAVGDPKAGTPRFDTHPALHERIEALAGVPGPPQGSELKLASAPAARLVEDWEPIERELLKSLDPALARLAPVAWEDIGEVVLRAWLRDRFPHPEPAFEGITIGMLGSLLPALVRRIGNIVFRREGFEPDSEELAAIESAGLETISAAVLLTVAESGWTLAKPLGRSVLLRSARGEFCPPDELPLLLDGTRTADQWAERCAELGIGDLPILAARED